MRNVQGFSGRVQSRNTVPRIMFQVLIALLPGIAAMTWFFGAGVLINWAIAILAAEVAEACVLRIRNKPVW